MTHQDTTAPVGGGEATRGSAGLPAIGAALLALIWGVYTLVVFYEIVIATPFNG